MFRIIGGDGNEYGPVSAELIQRWLAEGRVNALTKVRREGETEWRTFGETPELSWNAIALARPQTDGKAIASLICGILSLTPLAWFVAGIPAIILGHISRSEIRKSMGRLGGRGMALAGLIMGYVSLAALPLILIVATIAIPSLLRARQAANETAAIQNLGTIATAERVYKSAFRRYGTLEELISEALLDPRFDGDVSGYRFDVTATEIGFVATAFPINPNVGRYGYYIDADGSVRYSESAELAPAGRAGSLVQ